MPLVIQVKVKDGDVYCKPDPGRIKIKDEHGNVDKELQWHYGQGEFSIKFEEDLDTPFEDGTFEKESEDGWIRTIVKDHDDKKGYVYDVKISGTSEKADPGLVIVP